MSAPVPNLFVIGASKCGTTYFHDLLGQHPNIFMSRKKEPCYFIRPDHADYLEEYLAMFHEGAGHMWRGESSPAYSETLAFPNVARDIHRLSPDARIIYLVREPFARFKSVWAQTLCTGHWAEEKLFPMKMPRAYREAVFTYPTFLGGCRYWTNLSKFRTYFADEAIKVILFEKFIADVPGTVREVLLFLGVRADVPMELHAGKQNSRAGKTIYHPWSKRFGRLVPSKVKDMIPSRLRLGLRALVNRLPNPEFDHTDLTASEMHEIREQLAPEVRALYEYMGVKNDPWNFFPPLAAPGNRACAEAPVEPVTKARRG